MAEERRLDQAVIKIDGSPIGPELYELLSLVRVEESVHLPDSFTLRFNDPHFELVDEMRFTAGSKIEIAFSAEGDVVTVTKGEVTALSVEQGGGGRHELVVTGLDPTHRLARGPKTRTFQQMTDGDIVTQIASEYGLEFEVESTSDVHDYVIQSNQSDYAFLKQRGDRIGFDMWIADEKLYFKRRPESNISPPVLKWGTNLHKFKVRFSSAERCGEVTVRGWDQLAKNPIVGRAVEGDLGTTAAAAAEFSDAAESAFGTVARLAGQFPVHTQAEADALAQSLLLKASGDEVIVKAEATGDPMIAAGAMVEISSVGQKLGGNYRVTSVEHVYGGGTPYVTRFVCGGKDSAGLVDLVANGSAGGEPKKEWGSLVIGIVTNNSDDETLGRVKVKYPSLTDQDESAWAKVASPGAGPSRGLQVVPEVGDEVLIGFEHDDKRRPVVLGGLWNRTDTPPKEVVKGGEVAARNWTSRKGHYVELSDDSSDSAVRVGVGDASSKMTIEKTVTLEAQQKLVLKAPQVEISGDSEVTVRGGTIRLN